MCSGVAPCPPPRSCPRLQAHSFEAARSKAAELAAGLASYQPPSFEMPPPPEEPPLSLPLPLLPTKPQQGLEDGDAGMQPADMELLPSVEPVTAEESLGSPLEEAPIAPVAQVPGQSRLAAWACSRIARRAGGLATQQAALLAAMTSMPRPCRDRCHACRPAWRRA